MADKSQKQAYGSVENVLVKVKDLYLPADFVILNTGEDTNDSIILGRPFLATERALIDVERGELVLSHTVPPDIKPKFGVGHSPPTKDGGGPKKKVPKGWRNKKIPTENFSPSMKVRCLHRHAEAGRQSPDGPLAFSRSHLPSPHPSSSSARPPPLTRAASQSPVKDHHVESQSRRAHQATTRQSRTAPEPTTSPPRRLPPLPCSALVSLVLFFFTEALPICFK
ncbi:uncharacterized protein LOC107479611 [Arachis duranensis]|uniref:Uncharacterized protein LOC107479611 n=1 Tax=Arachis duranensis TaxID=130453 RepID=A0A6P4CVK2_ARADU|nr:uncharacterized protein LOC107479611 [Arachis duranensis]